MSTLKVNKIRDTAGSADSITLDPNGGAVIAGVTTVSTIKVGSGVTISSDGDIFHTGVCTATSFVGDAANLTKIPAANIVGVCTSGLTKSGGFGKFLQLVTNEKSDTVSISGQNNGSSFGDVTGINVTITPTAASSKVLVQFCLGKVSHSSNSTGVRFTRSVAGASATAIKVGDTAGSKKSVSSNIFGTSLINTGHAQGFNYQFIDTPSYSVGQAIVYQMQVLTEGSNNFYVNRTVDDTNNSNIYFARAFSTRTAMEVSA